MGAYYASVVSPGSRGATFLAVCRGKVSRVPHALPVFPPPRELMTAAWGTALRVERAGPFPWAPLPANTSLEGSPLTLAGAGGVGTGGTEGEVPRT